MFEELRRIDGRVKSGPDPFLKVNPSGSMKYIAEVYHDGKSVRRTLGEHQIVKLQDAGSQAITLEGNIMFCRKSLFVKSGHNIVKI